jgi:hypothetical protein
LGSIAFGGRCWLAFGLLGFDGSARFVCFVGREGGFADFLGGVGNRAGELDVCIGLGGDGSFRMFGAFFARFGFVGNSEFADCFGAFLWLWNFG